MDAAFPRLGLSVANPPSPSLYRLAPINNRLSEASHSLTVSGCCANKEKAKNLALVWSSSPLLPPSCPVSSTLSLVAGAGRTNGNLLYAALSPPGPTTLASSASSTSQHRPPTASPPGCTSTAAIASLRVHVEPSRCPRLPTAKPRERRAEFDTGRPALLPGEPLQHPKRDKRIHVRR